MKMNHKRFYSILVGFIIVSLLIGFLMWQRWAVQLAIQACNPAHGFQPVELPTEFHAKLTTYEKAEPATSNLYTAENPVWVIEMKGRWLLVGGPPPSTPGPSYTEECTIIIDAQRGESLSLIRPDHAIQLAIQACDSGYGLQPVEPPTEAEAKLIWGGAEAPPYDSDPARPVWEVWMKGRWLLVGGPQQEDPNSQPGYETQCVIKIDARTGGLASAPIE